MTNAESSQLVLAIESAIGGGSLSLLLGGSEIGHRIGAAGVSRAEDLLVEIDGLLRSNGVAPRDLNIVAASAGPGSFTGVRIGVATALGLARGSGATFSSVSLLQACAAAFGAEVERSVAIPVGRGSVALQSFACGSAGVQAASKPEIVAVDTLAEALERVRGFLVLHETLAPLVADNRHVEVLGKNLAYHVAKACAANPVVTEPIFLSKT